MALYLSVYESATNEELEAYAKALETEPLRSYMNLKLESMKAGMSDAWLRAKQLLVQHRPELQQLLAAPAP